MNLTRRSLLRGAALTVVASVGPLFGCSPSRALMRPPEGPVHLGWRWLPGDTQRFATRLALIRPARWTLHTALWSYVATSLQQDGTIDLLASHIGSSAQRGQGPLPPRSLPSPADPGPATPIRFALDGRLPDPPGETLDEQLSHRMIGAALPPHGVTPGDSWSDPSLIVPFLSLIPPSLPVTSQARTTLEALEPAALSWQARLVHSARLSTVPGGPTLLLRGQTRWRAVPGLITERWLEVRMSPDVLDGDDAVGTLRAESWHAS